MKLKDYLNIENNPKPLVHRTYEDFVDDPDTPLNSISFDEEGHITSNKLSILRFVDWLLQEYEYLPEKNNNKKVRNNKKSKKKNFKKSKSRKKRKIMKSLKQFVNKNNPLINGNNLDYLRKIGNSQDFNNDRYYNQPFSTSAASPRNIPAVSNDETSNSNSSNGSLDL